MMPRKIGPYEIRAELGKGGMATVYRAYQPAVDRDVAIKVINLSNSTANALERFAREPKLIARLQHPNILPIYDFDATHDPPYIVMQHVDGGTLKDLLARGGLSFAQIADLLRQLADALDFAHERDIIHRDIKPSNILLDQRGHVFVADFGIARSVNPADQQTDLTNTGTLIGTPGYMAPEQSSADAISPQADLYALGVVFFEMLTGQLPYSGESKVAVILKHMNEAIPTATSRNPDLPVAVDAVIAKAMAKNPAERYRTATEFAQAAIDALNGSVAVSVASSRYVALLPRHTNHTEHVTEDTKLEQDRLSIYLLGSMQVILNGTPVIDFDTEKNRALFVFLLIERSRPHRRESLAELFWPDQDGRAGLRQALSTLRKAIGDKAADPPYLLISRETLQFNPYCRFSLDLDEFTALITACQKHPHTRMSDCAECVQRLEKAIELYRGEFAQDILLPDNDEFQNWLSFQREAVHQQVIAALYTVAEYYLQQGKYDLALRFAWRQIELEPWREEAYMQLMRLLALSGQRMAALAQYERFRVILKEQLNIVPSAEMDELCERIEVGDLMPAPQYADPAASLRRTNLPAAPTSFVGRQKELAQILHFLADPAVRLVTIAGLGGMGKTRLALEATRQAESQFPNVYFVPLASLTSPDLLPSAIADALHFSTTRQDTFTIQLVNYLSDKILLLTLDNFEHLTGSLDILREIIAHAPGVKLLVTSREKLNLQGEWVLILRGLPITAPDQPDSAVSLFIQRAKMANPDFVITDPDLSIIHHICQLVDGMPLAIELAAAWIQMLTCQEIADGIASSLSFLTASTRDLPERHQSLRAVFEHSWALLTPEQQRVFSALSIFRGGFQADAALEIASASLPTLLVFVSKSLLHRDPAGRYQIHELLRQYALEKLESSSDTVPVYTRHLRYYVNLVDTAELYLRGSQQMPWLDRLEDENDNLRTALEFAYANHHVETGLHLSSSLWFFWHVRNYFREGLSWLQKFIDAATDVSDLERAKALFTAGWLAQNNRDFQRAVSFSRASLQLAEAIGDQRSIAYPLSTLAWLSYFQGDYDQANTLGEASLALFRVVNDAWGFVHTLNILGYIAESQANFPRAEQYQREGVTVARAAGDNDSLGWSLYLLGRVMGERSDYAQSIDYCTQSLELYRENHNKFGIALSLYTLADAALALGELDKAEQLAHESVALLRDMTDLWAVGGPLSCLGMVYYRKDNVELATKYSNESFECFKQFGDKRGMAYTTNTLACIAQDSGDIPTAISLFQQSLTLREGSGIRRGMAVCFERLAEIAAAQADPERAAVLLGISDNLRQTIDAFTSGDDQNRHIQCVEVVRQSLGDTAFTVAYSHGNALSLDAAITYARHTPAAPS